MRTLALRNSFMEFLIAGTVIILSNHVAKNLLYFSPMRLLMIASAFLGVCVLLQSKYAILAILINIFFFDWLSNTVGVMPRQFTWIPEIMLISLSMKLVCIRMMERKALLLRTPIDRILLMVIISAIVTSMVHSAHPITTLLGFRNYLKYILMFYLIINLGFDERAIKQIITCFLVLMAIQIPISTIQRLSLGPDYSGGVLGPGLLGLLSLSVISTMLGFALYRGMRVRCILFSLLLMLTWIVSSAKAPFFLLPPTLLFLMRRRLFRRSSPILVSTVIVILVPMYFIAVKLFPTAAQTDLGHYLFSPRNAYYAQLGYEKSGGLNRLSGIAYAHGLVRESPVRTLFGVGPGNASSSFFSRFNGRFYLPGASLMTQLARVILEFGYLGFFLFLMMIFKVFRMNSDFMSKVGDSYWKSISFGFEGTIFCYVLGIAYFPVWNDDLVPFTFWFFASAIYVVGKKRNIVRAY